MISVLCNPGIRERHWHQMSDICGRDITPDAGTTLRKIKKMELEEFMDQFESISGNLLHVCQFMEGVSLNLVICPKGFVCSYGCHMEI